MNTSKLKPNSYNALGLLSLTMLLGAGCTTQQLHVVADPPLSQISIVNAKGKTVKTGLSSLDLPVSFQGNLFYSVTVTPPTAEGEKYLPVSTNLTQLGFQKLPIDMKETTKRMDVRLEPKLYVEVPSVEFILDSQHKWRGAVVRARAYKDVNEVGGTAPSRIKVLAEHAGIQGLSLSPDGNRIVYSEAKLPNAVVQKVFESAEPKGIEVGGANLNIINMISGGIEHPTSEDFRDMFPSFTANGQNILFTSNRRRSDSEDILQINSMRRSGISDVFTHRDARMLRPTQADDGQTMSFCIDEPRPIDVKQRFTIWTLGGANQFPTEIQTGSHPCISPDGKRIAYIGPDGNLFVSKVDGSQTTQLTFTADKILENYKKSLSVTEARIFDFNLKEYGAPEKMPYSWPSWSRDSKRIVYTGMEGTDSTGRPNEDIWIMDYDGSNRRQLTTNGSIDRFPQISPDNKWVYFVSNRGGSWAIWRVPTQEELDASAK
ncbi:MAG: transcriptional regulatory protein-like protein [Verrucomicrobiales bacterium]|nr:transcriptional regulatory protein-like protein [Verrucomicrobiales bacterium]